MSVNHYRYMYHQVHKRKKSWKKTIVNDIRLVGVCEVNARDRGHKENKGVPSTYPKPAFKPAMMMMMMTWKQSLFAD